MICGSFKDGSCISILVYLCHQKFWMAFEAHGYHIELIIKWRGDIRMLIYYLVLWLAKVQLLNEICVLQC